MKREQLSIIAAGVVALLAMAAHDNWVSSFVGWIAKKPNTLASSTNLQTNTTGSPGGTQGLNLVPIPGSTSQFSQTGITTPSNGVGWQDWQAGIAAYIVMFLAAETDAAPLVEVIAWGVATGYIFRAVYQGGGLNFKGIADTVKP